MRADARGLLAAEAAVELLIGHEGWLHRADFVDDFVEFSHAEGAVALAWVDWQAAVAALEAGRLACSHSETQLLRVAASIAEGVPVDLRDAVSGLDQRNLVLVAAALLHAGGDRDVAVGLLEGVGR